MNCQLAKNETFLTDCIIISIAYHCQPQMSFHYPFLVRFKMKMIKSIIVLLAICIAYITANCNDITLDECGHGFEPPFESSFLGTIGLCQRFCHEIYNVTCQFFTYNKKDHTCSLYATNPVDFAESCDIVGGTPDINPYDCFEPMDQCAVS